MKIGIEAIAFHAPQHYIDLTELAEARDIEPEKFTKGLGQEKMAIVTPPEDTVHLAINAAKKALTQFGIDPSEIGTLVVGTESGVDHSKPVAVYVHQALGLRSNCNTYETKHACFGAMAAVSSAYDWIASGRAKGSKALIIAADIARYEAKSAAEATQGAGAVAMVISDHPKLMYFDPNIKGVFTKQVMDFWRPLYSKTAFTDGHYSIDCYLDALDGTLLDAAPDMPGLDNLQACLYHVPFVKMASKAHFRHFENDIGQRVDRDDKVATEIRKSYSEKVAPWLSLNSIVGNIYTGSLFLALIDFLRQGVATPEKPVSLFSYGSGCAASLNVFYPSPGFEKYHALLNPEPELNARVKLSIPEYEKLMEEGENIPKENCILDPSRWKLTGEFLYLGNQNHIRQYEGFE